MAEILEPAPNPCEATWKEVDENGKEIEVTCGVQAMDAHNDIKIEDIIAACQEINDKATEIRKINNLVRMCAEKITKKELCINDTGIENLRELCCGTSEEQILSIIADIEAVEKRAIDVFNERQRFYNDKAKLECESRHE